MSASKGCSVPAASFTATSEAAPRPATPPSSGQGRRERSVAASRLTYLDHNATAPVRPAVAAAVAEALALVGNPSSVHRAGRAARRAVETARRAVSALVGAEAREVVFVSGGSEANQLALRGSGRRRILVSAIEHDSVLTAVVDAEILPVDPNTGIVDLALLADRLAADKRPALVSFMREAAYCIATLSRRRESCRSTARCSAPISSRSRRTSWADRKGSARCSSHPMWR